MLYKKYYNRMEKLAKMVETIKKHRVLIMAIIGALLAMLVAFLSVRGTLTEDISISSDQIVYGQQFECKSKALFGKTGYQYRTEDGKWEDGLPSDAGEYFIRTYSVRTFGVRNYGKQKPVVIDKKPLTITLLSQSIVYGETPVTTQSGFVKGDSLKEIEIDYNKNVGTSFGQIISDSVVVVNKKGEDVTRSYQLLTVGGNVSVTKKHLELTVAEVAKTYDGTPLTFNGKELSEIVEEGALSFSELAFSDSLEIAFNESITDYGRKKNTPNYKILNELGQDVSSNYLVAENFGDLVINKRYLKVKPQDVSKIYDAQPLTAEAVEIVDGSIIEGHEFCNLVFNGSLTDAGVGVCSVSSLKIKQSNEDKTFNYDITFVNGGLEVFKREVAVGIDAKKVYDAQVLAIEGGEEISIISGDILSGQVFKITSNEAKAKLYELEEVVYSITSNGLEVTSNYSISIEQLLFEITKREIVITALSASKTYDDTPLVKDGFSTENLVDGHIVNATVVGSITNVGEPVPNVVTFISVSDGNADVSENYAVTEVNGTLTINPREVHVKVDARKTYDDTLNLTADQITTNVFKLENDGNFTEGLYGNQTLDFTTYITTSDTSAKIHKEVLRVNTEEYDVVNGLKENYQITWFDGDLTIDRRDITIKTLRGSKVYNGEWQTNQNAQHYNVVEWHTVKYKDWLELKNVSTEKNSVVVAEIIDNNDQNDQIDNYNIHYEFEDFSITPRKISLAYTDYKVYDDVVFTVEDVKNHEYSDGSLELVGGHLLRLETIDKNANVYSGQQLIWNVYDEVEDYSANYELNLEQVELNIEKRGLIVRLNNVFKIYDAQAYSATVSDCEVDGLLSTHTFSCLVESDSVSVGVGEISVKSWQVKLNGKETDLSDNYLLNDVVKAVLTIDKCQVSVKVDLQKVYDDTTDVKNAEKSVTILRHDGGDTLYLDHTFEFEFELDGLVNAGEHPLVIKSYRILSKFGEVDGNYQVKTKVGRYVIDKREITLSTNGKTKVYDGESLSVSGIALISGSLVSGHIIAEGVAPSITQVDSIANEIPFLIKLGEENKTPNYDIVYNTGTLKIIEREIVILISNYTAVYNGEYHSYNNLTCLPYGGDGLLGNDEIISMGDFIATKDGIEYNDQRGLKNSGYYVITANPEINYEDDSYIGYYKFTFEMGEFVINKAELHVVSKSIVSKDAITSSQTDGQWYLGIGEVAPCDKIEVKVVGEQYVKGSSSNTISFITISDQNGDNLEIFEIDASQSDLYESENYLIKVIEGTLTVK